MDPLLDTDDIFGIDLKTNSRIAISDKPSNQSLPAISGSVVVWQDSQHSCPTCERDILGKDLATGVEFAVATGPNDQAFPSIDGKTVVWIEVDSEKSRLLTTEINSKVTKELAVISHASDIVTLGYPVISNEYVVWAELQKPTHDQTTPSRLLAFNRKTGDLKQITEWYGPSIEYTVADHRIVWADGWLYIADLSTSETSVLYKGRNSSPMINGDVVIWSTRSDDNSGLDIWGLNLKDRKPLPLVTGEGKKNGAVITGNRLYWRNVNRANDGEVISTSLSEAFVTAPEREKARKRQPEAIASKDPPLLPPVRTMPDFTRPLLKGIFAPRNNFCGGGGCNPNYAWTSGGVPSGIDALVANRNNPYFGSVTVEARQIDGYPYNPTGINDDPRWGPEVRHAMRTLQRDYQVRVIVKVNPEDKTQIQPNQNMTVTTRTVGQQVRNSARSWIQHMQVHNEPNLEWAQTCAPAPCRWDNKAFVWQNQYDPNFYRAINAWYTNVYYEVERLKNEDPDLNVRDFLRHTTLWTPPMLSLQYDIPGAGNYYEYLGQMIGNYHRFSYHMYPSPPYDTAYGILYHNQWYRFPTWLQDWITFGTVLSQITEFGWDGNTMRTCGYTHDDWWSPTAYNPSCNTSDGQWHRFEADIDNFFISQRYYTEAITVWITSGWLDGCNGNCGSDRAGGIWPTDGSVKYWFNTYRNSSPSP